MSKSSLLHDVFSPEPFHATHHLNEPAVGLHGYISIHSLARGPAFGGCRLWTYANDQDALADARRLAEGMTYKNALAGLPFGGGKAVLMAPAFIRDRSEYFRAFGRAVERLHGAYITAEDVGTTALDMRAAHIETRYVSGITRLGGFGGDPSRFTAIGVFLAIKTAVAQILRRDTLEGVRVAIQGVGGVGSRLCYELSRAGARLSICDTFRPRADAVAELWSARLVDPERFLDEEVDVLAPCALGGILDEASIDRLRVPIIAGGANNQLATLDVGDRLHQRGIWYLPDFLVNAGGIIAVAHEYLRTGGEEQVLEHVGRIAERVKRLISSVRATDEPPARVALAWAREAVARPGSIM